MNILTTHDITNGVFSTVITISSFGSEMLSKEEELNLLNEGVEIVSGGARGADKLGERYAAERGYGLKIFPADWNRYGKRAGYLRNEQMAQYADVCICFWDGESRGTKHMIDLSNRCGLKVIVNNYKENDDDIDFV